VAVRLDLTIDGEPRKIFLRPISERLPILRRVDAAKAGLVLDLRLVERT
jgi:hypothetical protein